MTPSHKFAVTPEYSKDIQNYGFAWDALFLLFVHMHTQKCMVT